eukprot:snap_masked-scaffold_9-processed-gene-8.36-mRNA-1 protein AED:1.00 eAED:1.00 QI:0/-1/0/0/-1/1/1/0/507
MAEVSEDISTECMICTKKMLWIAIPRCNHLLICHMCCLKLRLLSSDSKCILCKQESTKVYFAQVTRKGKVTETDFSALENLPELNFIPDEMSNCFFYKKPDAFKALNTHFQVQQLRLFKCTVKECPEQISGTVFDSLQSLNSHLISQHKQKCCELCFKSGLQFPKDIKRFSFKDFERHCDKGEAKRMSPPHPKCIFCFDKGKPKRFYDEEQLFHHLNHVHENCFVCKKSGREYDYYRDRRSLFEHFKEHHFLCEEPMCKDNFQVFDSELELKIHRNHVHPEKREEIVIRGSFVSTTGLKIKSRVKRFTFQPKKGSEPRNAGEIRRKIIENNEKQKPKKQEKIESKVVNRGNWTGKSYTPRMINSDSHFPSLGNGSSKKQPVLTSQRKKESLHRDLQGRILSQAQKDKRIVDLTKQYKRHSASKETPKLESLASRTKTNGLKKEDFPSLVSLKGNRGSGTSWGTKKKLGVDEWLKKNPPSKTGSKPKVIGARAKVQRKPKKLLSEYIT